MCLPAMLPDFRLGYVTKPGKAVRPVRTPYREISVRDRDLWIPVADPRDRSLWDENVTGGSKAKIYTAISRKVAGKNVHATIPKGYKDMSNTLLMTV